MDFIQNDLLMKENYHLWEVFGIWYKTMVHRLLSTEGVSARQQKELELVESLKQLDMKCLKKNKITYPYLFSTTTIVVSQQNTKVIAMTWC